MKGFCYCFSPKGFAFPANAGSPLASACCERSRVIGWPDAAGPSTGRQGKEKGRVGGRMLPVAGKLKHHQSPHQGSGSWKQSPTPPHYHCHSHHRAAYRQQASPPRTLTAKSVTSSQASQKGRDPTQAINQWLSWATGWNGHKDQTAVATSTRKKKKISQLLLLRSHVDHVVVCTGRSKIL